MRASRTKKTRYIVYYGSKRNPQSGSVSFDNRDSAITFYEVKSVDFEVQAWEEITEITTRRIDK